MQSSRQNYFYESTQKLLGNLLAFIILFQKKIQQLRIKLAGNQQFHSRLAFQLIDSKRKSNLYPQDLVEILNRYNHSVCSMGQVEDFCRKYTSNGVFSYDQFIKFISPKTNKILAQRLMIRTYRTGTQIPTYVIKILFQLLSTAINMIGVTQNLRKKIQQNSQLTHIQLLELYRKNSIPKDKLFYFINGSAQGNSQYDFNQSQIDYLCFHIKGNCDLQQIQDHQLKQLLCPLDMNFQKTFNKTFHTSNNNRFKTEYDNQRNTGGMKHNQQFYQTNNHFRQTYTNTLHQNNNIANKTVNFLNTNYQQTYKNFRPNKANIQPQNRMIQKFNGYQQSKQFDFEQNVITKPPTPMNLYYSKNPKQLQRDPYNQQSRFSQPNQSLRNKNLNVLGNLLNMGQQQQQQQQNKTYDSIISTNMYIDKFAKVPTGDGTYNKRVQLDNYLNNKKRKQQFDDDLNNNNNKSQYSDDYSRGSAFLQY